MSLSSLLESRIAASVAPSRFDVGGQAVLEGVMMRSPRSFAVVCRWPDGQLVVREDTWTSVWERLRFLRWPFLRGGVVLVESLVNGVQALAFSANQQAEAEAEGIHREMGGGEEGQERQGTEERREREGTEERREREGTEERREREGRGERQEAEGREEGREGEERSASPLSRGAVASAMVIALAFGLLLFVGLPHLLSAALGFSPTSTSFHIVDGALRVAIFLAYLLLIARMRDIQRVFEYHGAEHKAIFTYEAGEPLDVEHARGRSRFHPRCGTSFLLIVIVVSIVVFALLLRQPIFEARLLDNLIKVAIKVPLMLPVAGIAYEAIRFSGRHREHPLTRLLCAPGLWLQRLTTREPDDSQIEVALCALRKTLWRERSLAAGASPARSVQRYASYAEVEPLLC